VFTPILLPAFNPGPMTGEGNNTYLLVDAHGSATLIDAGVGDPRHLESLERALDESHAHLDTVLVTHIHGDHAKGAVPIAAAYPDARFFKSVWPGEDERYPVSWQSIDDGQQFGEGEQRLTAVFTPGHSPDHMAFWQEPTRTVFVGDLVVAGTTVMIAASKGGDLTDYLSSLERIRVLNPARLLPAHGTEVVDPGAILARYTEHRLHRERHVIHALSRGLDTVQSITESIYHGLSPALIPAAAENVRAHLDKLTKEGRARREQDRWRLT
jgi:glyoxylase-like metal-dependent hydrolase (beta-lactamase superfamily II)